MKDFGFTFNGRNSLELGVWTLNVDRPLLPSVTTKMMTIPERHGAHYFGYQYEPLEIKVSIAFDDPDLVGVQEKRHTIADWLNPEASLQPLIFDDEPDKQYVAVLSKDSELAQTLTLGKGELTFLVPDPFAYAVSDDVFTYTGAGAYSFDRQGTVDSYPLIELQGTNAPSDRISISLNDSHLSFLGTLNGGDTLILDSNLLTAKINRADGTVVSAMNDINNLDFPITVPGSNQLDISPTGASTVTFFKITCRSRWI
ncbi:distal tail protein Dit [Alkalihalobacillus sp. AL-G]|uniref:distal tail protein Dit n=1 Tax=Alkalihalobacillus sp. AL-G TaxID=2926399 RepID=UPI00272A40A9|nr:distal tail protein Dit [Alkalihalobacillus sp. AL-G]WLD92640.1 phage tail family protein [Alkalihalobacillus sp. AL-G]